MYFAYEVNATTRLNVAMVPDLATIPMIFLEEKIFFFSNT